MKIKLARVAPLSLAFSLFFASFDGATADQEQNNREPFDELQAKAEQGDPAAQSNLGLYYSEGKGIPKDFAEAVKWFRKAAEQGYAEAQHNLALCYAQSEGVPQDYAESARWDRKAAEQGFAQAQLILGIDYQFGLGVPQDQAQAYKWMNLSAAQGSINAKITLTEFDAGFSSAHIAEGQRMSREFKPNRTLPPNHALAQSKSPPAKPEGSGTGFFLSEDGFIVTNAHLVTNVVQIQIVTTRGLLAAQIVKVDAIDDLAVLKAEGAFSALPIIASRYVRLGAAAATIGFPNVHLQGFSPKLARGEVASLSGVKDDPRHFQISVPIQPGNSGGALFDERGNVIGVIVAKLSVTAALATSGQLPENVNYAIKSSFLLSFLESLPDVAAKVKQPDLRDRKFEDVAADVQKAAVLVVVH